MIDAIQLDSLIRALEGGWVTEDQVPEELLKQIEDSKKTEK